jgi:hypothetical protein
MQKKKKKNHLFGDLYFFNFLHIWKSEYITNGILKLLEGGSVINKLLNKYSYVQQLYVYETHNLTVSNTYSGVWIWQVLFCLPSQPTPWFVSNIAETQFQSNFQKNIFSFYLSHTIINITWY